MEFDELGCGSMSSTRTRHVESWLDWSVDEMWDTPRSRRGVAERGVAETPPAVRSRSAGDPDAGPAPEHPAPERRAPRQAPTPARRTVTISGRGTDRHAGVPYEGRPRPQRRKHERPGYRPDRAAMWAVLLGVVLLLVAATSSRGATPPAGHKQAAARVMVIAAPAHPAGRLR